MGHWWMWHPCYNRTRGRSTYASSWQMNESKNGLGGCPELSRNDHSNSWRCVKLQSPYGRTHRERLLRVRHVTGTSEAVSESEQQLGRKGPSPCTSLPSFSQIDPPFWLTSGVFYTVSGISAYRETGTHGTQQIICSASVPTHSSTGSSPRMRHRGAVHLCFRDVQVRGGGTPAGPEPVSSTAGLTRAGPREVSPRPLQVPGSGISAGLPKHQ